MAIPLTPEDVTPAWLTGVLHAYGLDARVRTVRAEFMQSLTAAMHRVVIEYEDGADPAGPRTLIWKHSSTDPAVRSAWAYGGSVYEREVRFYRDMAPALRARIPTCYLAEYDAETDEHVLLLEDLSNSHSAAVWSRSIGPEGVRAVLRELALLHASHWGEFTQPAARTDSTRQFFATCLEEHRAFLTDMVGDELMHRLERYVDVIVPWDELADRERYTFIHVDLHPKNVLFPSEPRERPVLVDWQGARAGSAGRDLGILLGFCLDENDRRTHERALVREYCELLRSQGIDYNLERAWREYRVGSARLWLFRRDLRSPPSDLGHGDASQRAVSVRTRGERSPRRPE